MAAHYFEESWLNCSDRFVKKDIGLKKLSEIKDLCKQNKIAAGLSREKISTRHIIT